MNMSNAVHLDFETYSPVDLTKHGMYNYFDNELTDVWCASYYIEGDDVKTWRNGDPAPTDLLDAVRGGATVYAHNAMFEYLCWNEIMRERHGWPELKLDQLVDTMAMCQSMALPGALNNAFQFLDKEKINRKAWDGGYKIMKLLMQPDANGDKPVPTPEQYDLLVKYCEGDVVLEHHLVQKIGSLSPLIRKSPEHKIWQMHQRMNVRGVKVDVALAEDALFYAQQEAERLNARIAEITNGEVTRTTQVARIKKYLLERHNLAVKSLSKDTIDEVIDKVPGGISSTAQEVINLRMAAAKSSVSKYKRMLELKSGDDERLRGMFRYSGAMQTKRTSSTGVQLQNLVRDAFKPEEVDAVVAGLEEPTFEEDFGMDVYTALSRLIRTALIPENGNKFVVMDYSAVEARGLAWLTNNHRVLQAFRHSDADKDAPDLYEVTYAGMFGLEPESVTKDQRFIGKVATLALGYGGGENAFAKMARAYGADIPQHEAIAIKTKWRQANPMVQRWWYDLEQTIRKVLQKRISDPVLVSSGLPSVTYRFDGQHLWCGLPSGGEICYPFARIAPAHPSSPFEPAIVYAKATHTPAANRPSNWPTQNLYGGLAAENITQALCRDMLMDAMLEIDEEVDGKLIMTVHDEVVVECRAPIAEDVHDQVKAIMSKVPDWAAGFPLAAEGGIVDRYTKV